MRSPVVRIASRLGVGLIVGVVLIGALWLWLDYQTNADLRRQAEAQRLSLSLTAERDRLAQEQTRAAATAPLWSAVQIAWSLLLIAIPVGVVLVVVDAYLRRRAPLVRPDANGLLPVDRERLTYGAHDQLVGDVLRGHHQVQALRAVHQPGQTPHTLHYSPRPGIAASGAPGGAQTLSGADLPRLTATLPPITDLADLAEMFTPTPDRILLGLDASGLLTARAQDLCHVALCGATGGGKSSMLRLMLSQLLHMQAQVVMADPHYTPLDMDDPDAGDWRPIAQRLYMPPAISPEQIRELLCWLNLQLDQRIALRRQAQSVGRPLFFAFDELPVIVKEVPQATETIGRLLREGRKVKMFTVGASQDFLVKTIGSSGAIRDCYRTAYYAGGDQHSASILLDLPRREIDDRGLGQGVAMLRCASTGEARRVRVPWATNAGVRAILGDHLVPDVVPLVRPALVLEPPPEPRREPSGSTHQDGINPRLLRVTHMLREKASQNQIIEEIWGVQGKGRSYQEAAEEFRGVLAEIACRAVV